MYYSQCGEDKFLNENFFKGKTNGVYIEMGAVDGLFQSNTKFFEDQLNWTGILIEPQPNSFKKLQMNRPNKYTRIYVYSMKRSSRWCKKYIIAISYGYIL